MKYEIIVAPAAERQLMSIEDKRVRGKIADQIDKLGNDPDIQGKPLSGELSGYRSVRAGSQRYRIIYRIEKHTIVVYVVAVGMRKEGSKTDIYNVAKKLFSMKLLKDS